MQCGPVACRRHGHNKAKLTLGAAVHVVDRECPAGYCRSVDSTAVDRPIVQECHLPCLQFQEDKFLLSTVFANVLGGQKPAEHQTDRERQTLACKSAGGRQTRVCAPCEGSQNRADAAHLWWSGFSMPCLCEHGTTLTQPLASVAGSSAVYTVNSGSTSRCCQRSWCHGSDVPRPAGLFMNMHRNAEIDPCPYIRLQASSNTGRCKVGRRPSEAVVGKDKCAAVACSKGGTELNASQGHPRERT